MKKPKNRERYIKLSAERFERNLSRKRFQEKRRREEHKRQLSICCINKKRSKLKRKTQAEEYTELKPPSNFSIINNPNQTISFFEDLRESILNYDPVSVNMSEIENMTVDALVYYIATLQKLKTKLKAYTLKGSFPKDEKILTLMKRSGFLKYFKTDEDNIQTHADYIQIKSGNIADNITVKKVCEFVIDKFATDRLKTKKLYDIISEMMLNTKQHAYNGNTANYDNWLIFTRYYPEKNNIDFIFMDTGYGIPQTVRKDKWEIAKEWFAKMNIFSFSESDLVDSALQGAYRTKTGKGYRGKGLPKIYSYFKEGYIKKLTILSNKACLEPNTKYDLEKELIGTLFYWKITKESLNENS